MTNIKPFARRLERVQAILQPPIRDTRLPTVYLDPATFVYSDPSTWRAFPGCEAHNQEMEQLARYRAIAPHYLVMGPDQDGIEP